MEGGKESIGQSNEGNVRRRSVGLSVDTLSRNASFAESARSATKDIQRWVYFDCVRPRYTSFSVLSCDSEPLH